MDRWIDSRENSSVVTQISRWSRRLAHWAIPNHCYLCGEDSRGFLCPPCQDQLAPARPCCRTCALPLATDHARECGDCLTTPKPFTRTLAAFTYAPPLDFLINRFKHKRAFNCGDFLSGMLLDTVTTQMAGEKLPDFLMPVPLHWTRRFSRGFNQAELIAEHLSRGLTIPVSHGRRLKPGRKQQGLDRRARLRNLRAAFALHGEWADRHIAIVDDVMTTGATVTELAHALTRAGAARVDVWVLARVP